MLGKAFSHIALTVAQGFSPVPMSLAEVEAFH